nr:translocation/assembly module TamB [Cytophagales bacterium]
MANRKHFITKLAKVVGWIVLSILILVGVLLLVIRSPWGQDYVVQKATSFLAHKTKTEVSIDRLFITFSGNIFLDGLYIEDKKGDTLIYSGKLETGVKFLPLIRTGKIAVSKLDWTGLRANVQVDSLGNANYDFIVEAFSGSGEDVAATQESSQDTTAQKESAAYPDISLGPVLLSDAKLSYVDDSLGLGANISLGKLALSVRKLDLNKMDFDVSEIDFTNSEISYLQEKPFQTEETQDPTEMPDPVLVLDRLNISGVTLEYGSVPDRTTATIKLGELKLTLPEANMAEKRVLLDQFQLHNSSFDIVMLPTEQAAAPESDDESTQAFEWPDWTIEVGAINLSDNNFGLRTGEEMPVKGFFNPSAIALKNFTLKANGIALTHEKAGLDLEAFSFSEYSGFVLRKGAFSLSVGQQSATLRQLDVRTGFSSMRGSLDVGYNSIEQVLSDYSDAAIDLQIPQVVVGLRDAFLFQPSLRSNPSLLTVSEKKISGSFNLKGTQQDLFIRKADVAWGNNTSITLRGTARNVLDIDQLWLNLDPINFETNKADLNEFLSQPDSATAIPENIQLTMAVKGGFEDLVADAHLVTPEGEIQLDADYSFDGFHKLQSGIFIDEVDLGSLIGNDSFGVLTYRAELAAQGTTLDDLVLDLSSTFETLTMYGYDYGGITLDADIDSGEGGVNLAFKDDNLDMVLSAMADLDSVRSTVDLELDIRGADLNALKLSSREIKTRIHYLVNWEGNLENFELNTVLEEGTFVLDDRPIPIDGFDINASVRDTLTAVFLESSILQLALEANAAPQHTIEALSQYFERVLGDSVNSGAVDSLTVMSMDLDIPGSQLLDQIILPELENWGDFHLGVDFDASVDTFNAEIELPYMIYAGIEIDSLGVRASGDGRQFELHAGIVSLMSDVFAMDRTYVDGVIHGKEVDLDFLSYDEEEALVHLALEIKNLSDALEIHISPDTLVLNKQNWEIPAENLIRYGSNSMGFTEVELTRGSQKLVVSNSLEITAEEHFGVVFQDFGLKTITSLLNPDSLIATGSINGSLIVENPFAASGIVADLNITDFGVFEVLLGDFALNAKSSGNAAYEFSLALKNGGIDFDLAGDYGAAETGANLNLNFDLNELKAEVLQGLLPEQLRDGQGAITGSGRVSGTTTDPIYEGEFSFNDFAVTVAAINSKYTVGNETIRLNNEGVYFDKFTINDSGGNTFTVAGSVMTEDLTNPSFDLQVTANNFRALNSTSDDNQLFYGTGIIDANVGIHGDLNLPRVDARLKVKKGTDFTFVIPETQLDIVERQGVVLFVDRQDPNDILTRREAEVGNTGVTGFQVAAVLEVDPQAIFNIVVDQRSGDNLKVSGKANLALNFDPNGRITLTGAYELTGGHYEMSLYNLVSRRFEIQEGSTITWSGDPLNAGLNVTALYRVRTSASELMAAQSGGADANVQYKQELPFLVYLDIEGNLTRLEPSFRLDMPEDQRGAAGGNIYGQIQLLNNQEGELNRQVFSLMVLNRFFPSKGTDGSGGGTAGLAKSSVSQLLSGQLNSLSESVLGSSGINLDFDLDSFTDYQSGAPQDRTQLNVNASSAFMDDRLIVQVGSQIDIEGSSQSMNRANSLLGNVSIEYLLTENGRYRLRGFRKNQFESFIDGQLIVTGLSVIFNREFDTFAELWKGIERKRKSIMQGIRKEEEQDESGDQEENGAEASNGKADEEQKE